LEQAEQDPDLIALSRQFKATAMELISVLEQVNNLSRTLHIYLLVSDSKSWLVPQFTEKIENSMELYINFERNISLVLINAASCLFM